jgi:hypothetical protein
MGWWSIGWLGGRPARPARRNRAVVAVDVEGMEERTLLSRGGPGAMMMGLGTSALRDLLVQVVENGGLKALEAPKLSDAQRANVQKLQDDLLAIAGRIPQEQKDKVKADLQAIQNATRPVDRTLLRTLRNDVRTMLDSVQITEADRTLIRNDLKAILQQARAEMPRLGLGPRGPRR